MVQYHTAKERGGTHVREEIVLCVGLLMFVVTVSVHAEPRVGVSGNLKITKCR